MSSSAILSGSRNSRMCHGADVLDRLVRDAEIVEMRCGSVQLVLAADPEGQVVEADAVLVETCRRPPAADQPTVAGAVDDATEQEPQLFPRLRRRRRLAPPAEPASRRRSRRTPAIGDVGDGQPDVLNGRRVYCHDLVARDSGPAGLREIEGHSRVEPEGPGSRHALAMSASIGMTHVDRYSGISVRAGPEPPELLREPGD